MLQKYLKLKPRINNFLKKIINWFWGYIKVKVGLIFLYLMQTDKHVIFWNNYWMTSNLKLIAKFKKGSEIWQGRRQGQPYSLHFNSSYFTLHNTHFHVFRHFLDKICGPDK